MLKKIKIPAFISKLTRRTWWIILAAVMLIGMGGYTYFQSVFKPAQASDEPTLQTATVRQGDLVIFASGSGTLIAADEVNLAFKTGGQVMDISVQVGDQVKVGDVLAQVDDTDANIAYTQARRNLLELTSVAAIATAQQAAAQAEIDLEDAINTLEYLLSPTVVYWEFEIIEAEQAVEEVQAHFDANPNDPNAQDALEKAETYLEYAQASLVGAQASYTKNYLPNTFTTWDRDSGKKYVAAPSDTEILAARAAVTVAEATLAEAQYLYSALTGGEVPEDATGSGLSDLEIAQLDLQAAQETLDGTKILAPISGTVMSVDTSVGDTVSNSSTVITVADLSTPYLEVFLDETDWGSIAVGYNAEIIFDALPDDIFTGVVTQVDPGLYTESNTSVVRALVLMDDTQGELNLPIGTGAAVDIIGGRAESAILVPVEALRETSPGEYAVFVIENGEPKMRIVEIGLQDMFYAEVLSGLRQGEIVSTGLVETE